MSDTKTDFHGTSVKNDLFDDETKNPNSRGEQVDEFHNFQVSVQHILFGF